MILFPTQMWTRILCALISGLIIVCLPPTGLEISAVTLSKTETNIHSKEIQLDTTNSWGFSFSYHDLEHQWMRNTLNITVNFTLAEQTLMAHSKTLTSLSNRITQFLTEYPNEDDYWEIVNRHLSQAMLQEYPALRSLTLSLEILPRLRIPYTCISTVTIADQNQITETWQFVSSHIPVHHPDRDRINLSVKYTYKPGITAQEYPDFVPIQHQISEMLMRNSNQSDSWEMLNRQLSERILAEHPTLTDVTLELEALPTSALPYAYMTTVFMSQSETK